MTLRPMANRAGLHCVQHVGVMAGLRADRGGLHRRRGVLHPPEALEARLVLLLLLLLRPSVSFSS